MHTILLYPGRYGHACGVDIATWNGPFLLVAGGYNSTGPGAEAIASVIRISLNGGSASWEELDDLTHQTPKYFGGAAR